MWEFSEILRCAWWQQQLKPETLPHWRNSSVLCLWYNREYPWVMSHGKIGILNPCFPLTNTLADTHLSSPIYSRKRDVLNGMPPTQGKVRVVLWCCSWQSGTLRCAAGISLSLRSDEHGPQKRDTTASHRVVAPTEMEFKYSLPTTVKCLPATGSEVEEDDWCGSYSVEEMGYRNWVD